MSFVNKVIVVAVLLIGGLSIPAQLAAQQADRAAEFLGQLTGDWSVVSEATLGPGQEPIRMESGEVARLIGGKWLVGEITAAPDEQPFTSIFTVGYNPAEEQFVGTWISSRQTHMWRYTGALDDSGTALTLETEGPIMGDPTRTAKYREIIEIEDADHKVKRSLILGPDGEWFEFARAEYRRNE